MGWLSAAVEKLKKGVRQHGDQKKYYDEHLRLASRDNSVAGNELGKDTAGRLNTEGKCGDVDENDILSAFLPREDTTLNSSTICDSLIRVDTLRRVFATEEFLEELLDLGYTSRTANEYNLILDFRNTILVH